LSIEKDILNKINFDNLIDSLHHKKTQTINFK